MKQFWEKAIRFGSEKAKDKEELRQLILLNRVILLGTLTISTFVPLAFYLDLPVIALNVILGISFALFTFAIIGKGTIRQARIYFFIVSLTFVMYIHILSGNESGTHIAFVLMGTLHLVLFRSTRWSWHLFILSILLMASTSLYVGYFGAPLDYVTEDIKKFSYYMNVLSAMFLVFSVVFYFKKGAIEFEATIVNKNEEISQKNKDITDSIQYAKRIQNSILPSESVVKAAFNDSFILYKPKDIVAGDFYWVEQGGEKAYFAVADCTGHGVPGALVSLICSNSMLKVIKEYGTSKPSEILDKTADLLEEHFSKTEEDVKDGMDVAFCVYDLKKKSLEYAGANRPLYLMRNGNLIEFKPDKQPIGKQEGRKPFTNHTIQLEPGDCIYLFTDGYSDQFGGTEGKKFKYSRFKELLHSTHSLEMDEQKKRFDSVIEEWKGSLEQVDDICVMGVRV